MLKDPMTPPRSGAVTFSLALRRINPTSTVLCVKKLIPAQKAGGATLPLCHVLPHKWWQVTRFQETQFLARWRLTMQGSLGEVGCGPDLVRLVKIDTIFGEMSAAKRACRKNLNSIKLLKLAAYTAK